MKKRWTDRSRGGGERVISRNLLLSFRCHRTPLTQHRLDFRKISESGSRDGLHLGILGDQFFTVPTVFIQVGIEEAGDEFLTADAYWIVTGRTFNIAVCDRAAVIPVRCSSCLHGMNSVTVGVCYGLTVSFQHVQNDRKNSGSWASFVCRFRAIRSGSVAGGR